MHIMYRMEAVDVRNPRGIAKIFGTLISLAGAMTMTLYKGPAVQSSPGAPIHITGNSVHENWTKGSILLIGSCISWSAWFIMQVLIGYTSSLINLLETSLFMGMERVSLIHSNTTNYPCIIGYTKTL